MSFSLSSRDGERIIFGLFSTKGCISSHSLVGDEWMFLTTTLSLCRYLTF